MQIVDFVDQGMSMKHSFITLTLYAVVNV